jgi:predicted nucleic acid-binding Zn ribbon protein
MAHARAVPALSDHGFCHFCDEPVALEALFCGSDCRDDYDREAAARRRAGVNAG